MKVQNFLVLLILLAFSGCSQPTPTTIVSTQYIKQDIPKPLSKPQADKYQLLQVKFNGVTYYTLTEAQAKILASNWIVYKGWAEGNYELLNNLYKNSKDSNISK